MAREKAEQYTITAHAAFEMARRQIPEQVVREILKKPEQQYMVREGREVVQSRIVLVGKLYLVRIFVDLDRNPFEVVTVYRTSKIEKYWRPSL
jgi:hypothetical protein